MFNFKDNITAVVVTGVLIIAIILILTIRFLTKSEKSPEISKGNLDSKSRSKEIPQKSSLQTNASLKSVGDSTIQMEEEENKKFCAEFSKFQTRNERVLTGFIHIIKSLYLFEEFKKIIREEFNNTEIGKRLIGYFEHFDKVGLVDNHHEMANLYNEKDLGYSNFDFNGNQPGFFFSLLDYLSLQSSNGSTISPHYKDNDNKPNTEFSEIINYENQSDAINRLKSIFAIFYEENQRYYSKNYNCSINRELFLKEIVKIGEKENFVAGNYNIEKAKNRNVKLYHVFFVSFKQDNVPNVLNLSDIDKICNINHYGKFTLKSFHVYYMTSVSTGILRMSVLKKDNVWIGMDTNEIVDRDVVALMLCSGNYNLQLFYERVLI